MKHDPNEWVVTFNGCVVRRKSTNLAIVRSATQEEIAAKQCAMKEQEEKTRAWRERTSRQDWKDCEDIQAFFEHDRERTISKLGAEFVHEIAERLRTDSPWRIDK